MYKTKQWILGLILSFLVIWSLSLIFIDSIEYYEWDKKFKTYVPAYGSIHRHRSEGWGDSYTGKYGIYGLDDIGKIKQSKIAIWGDSYIEAWQVGDQKKTAQVLSKILSENGFKNTIAVGIGVSGDDAADYYFKLPRIKAITPNVVLHCIVFSSINDFLPDIDNLRSHFISSPQFTLVESKWKPGFQKLKKLLSMYRMDFLWHLIKQNIIRNKLRFSIKTHNKKRQKKNVVSYNKQDALKFIIKKMREQTSTPIVLVYTPEIPSIEKGNINLTINNPEDTKILRKICKQNNIDFIDLTQHFIQFYERTGKFPRGFSNSRPSLGHFNEAGHRLIAKSIFDYYSAH